MLTSMGINGIEIFRADKKIENYVYKHIKMRVFDRYKSNKYTNKNEVKEIVNYMYEEYYRLLDDNLPIIDQWEFTIFLMNQYDVYGQVEIEYKKGNLTPSDTLFWRDYGVFTRRAIKHLLELLCIAGMKEHSSENISKEIQERSLSICFIAVEELVSLYMRSESYYRLYDDVTLILDASKYIYFNVIEDGRYDFDPRVELINADEYIGVENILRSPDIQAEILNYSFEEKFSINYLSLLSTLQYLILNLGEENENFCCFPLDVIIKSLSEDLKINEVQVSGIISGFSLTAESMLSEGRELYKPKQQYRAYKRGFFIFENEKVKYIIFSKRMARECFDLLVSDVCFRKIPPEWESNLIKKSLDKLSLEAGKWFERVVDRNLKSLGIQGELSVKSLKFRNKKIIHIPKSIGEIDFIGYSEKEKLLIIIEAKQVGFSSEPRMYIDDLDKFITSENGYVKKFQKKINWVIDNKDEVCKFLNEKTKKEVTINTIGYAMITHYPLYIASEIEEFSCLSLTKFMMEYKCNNGWVFSKINL